MWRFREINMGAVRTLIATMLLCIVCVAPLHAQDADANAPALVDPLGRETPRGAVTGYLAAMAAGDLDGAAAYLEVSDGSDFRARRLAEQLRLVLDRDGRLKPTPEISLDPMGRTGDGLDLDLDAVGTIGSGEARSDLFVRRLDAEDGAAAPWVFASESLALVPAIAAASEAGWIERLTPAALAGLTILGVSAGDWIALAGLAAAALVLGQFIAFTMGWVATRLRDRFSEGHGPLWIRSARMPIGLLFAVIIFKASAVMLGISVIGRRLTGTFADVAAVIALAWMALLLADHLAQVFLRHTPARARGSAISAVKLVRRVAKAIVITVAVVLSLDTLGVDITTGLAALGIGGIALALGAQKTIENLVGSVMLVADQPIRLGDFCRFGETMGTVEDIGMRSTRIRTLDETLVTIPNGTFSSMEIENYARRDRFRFLHVLGLRYETSPDQMEAALQAIRDILSETDGIIEDTVRVRFTGLGASTLDVEVLAYVSATDLGTFLEVQEALLLSFMRRMGEMGVGFAFPSRTVYVAQDSRGSPERGAGALPAPAAGS